MPRVAKPRNYMVTIKSPVYCYRSYDEIKDIYNKTVKKMTGVDAQWSSFIAWELDGLNRLHLHTTVKTRKSVNKLAFQQTNWSVHFTEYSDDREDAIQKYIHKHQQSPDALDDMDAISHTSFNLINNDYQKQFWIDFN